MNPLRAAKVNGTCEAARSKLILIDSDISNTDDGIEAMRSCFFGRFCRQKSGLRRHLLRYMSTRINRLGAFVFPNFFQLQTGNVNIAGHERSPLKESVSVHRVSRIPSRISWSPPLT